MNTNNKKQKKERAFSMQMLYHQLPSSIVVAISMGVSDVADSLVLGNRIGEIGLAAIALATPVFMMMNIIIQGFGPGGSIRYTTLLAEGKKEKAMETYRSSICFSIVFGILLAILMNGFMSFFLTIQGITETTQSLYNAASLYLRIVSTGSPIIIVSFVLNDFMRNEDMEKLASIGASVGNALDVILNIVLVLFLHMGVAGSGIATVTGKTVSLFIYVIGIFVRDSELKHICGGVSIRNIPLCFKTGSSTVIQYFSDMLFFGFVNAILMRMAGQTGIAVFDLIQNVSYMLMYLYVAFAEAGQPAVSTYTGEKNIDARLLLRKEILILGEMVTGILAVILFVFAETFCNIFGVIDASSIQLGVHAIRIYILGAPFMGASLILGSYYQSCDNPKGSYVIASLRGFIILFPITLLMSFTNIHMFFYLYPITELISLVLFVIYAKSRKIEHCEFEEERVFRYMIENDPAMLSDCCIRIEAFCEKWNANPKQLYMVQMAVEELIGAIIQYGFQGKNGLCEVTVISGEHGEFIVHIRDNATSFNPFDLKQKKNDLYEEDMAIVGVHIIRKKSKSFFYRRYQGFNTLVVTI